jgi:pimeloyl-ACP methyl ester carboxylesterase
MSTTEMINRHLPDKEASHILINDHHIYYERWGDVNHPAVVLLHHGLGSVGSWKYQISALDEAGFQVIAYDRWGYGHSSSRSELKAPYFEDDLADLHELLSRLKIHQVALVGHSDGGTISLYFASTYPKMVWALVTIAAHIYIEPKMASGIDAVRKAFETDTRFAGGLKRLHGEKTQQVFDNWYQAWMKPQNLGWDMRPCFHEITCKSLIVQGLDDEHANPKHAQDVANAMNSVELWLVPKAKHMFPQEQSRIFNEKLVTFLSECWSTRNGRGR